MPDPVHGGAASEEQLWAHSPPESEVSAERFQQFRERLLPPAALPDVANSTLHVIPQ